MLGKTEEEKDIGVIMTKPLKPVTQCAKATRTAGAVLSQIIWAFHFRGRHVFKGLYVQYMRPHLEFASAAWSPWTEADKECLEKFQERAVKMVSGLKSGTRFQTAGEGERTTRAMSDLCKIRK